jgi:hypothetical protein
MKLGEGRHLARVSELPCCTCGSMPVECHHIEGISTGKRDQGHYLTIPLCPDCHRGSKGVHGDKTMLQITKKTELELLNETLGKLYGEKA